MKGSVLSEDKNLINVVIESDPPGTPWNLMGVYGPPTLAGKEAFWNRIGDVIMNNVNPSMIIGDLNGTLADHENLHYSNWRNPARYSFDLRRMVARTGIVYLGSQGGKFTWFQKSKVIGGGCGLKRARLDRALASIEWRMPYPSGITHALSAATSDHRPILLDTNGGANCSKSQFKYELMWGRDPKCHWVVKNAWKEKLHQHPMINFYRKLKKTKEHLARWNKVHFKQIRHQVNEARSSLQQLKGLDNVNGEDLTKARHSLNEALAKEEIFWRRKSRVKWLQQGDSCTKFFMATTVIRRRRNYIQQVWLEDGGWERNLNNIANLFVERFSNTYIDKKSVDLPSLNFLEDCGISTQVNELLKASQPTWKLRGASDLWDKKEPLDPTECPRGSIYSIGQR
ncbi:uncharacterized protein LOC133031503 [Cannabis sativa]|uniref:uncharacterized protein LOC133031503 n=1 Tax=Cannabis sativa TaxID=3483 RepID=UPI0029CA0D75|nr:uncharacterized protein LOC133031503 [Cannabis sativa]